MPPSKVLSLRNLRGHSPFTQQQIATWCVTCWPPEKLTGDSGPRVFIGAGHSHRHPLPGTYLDSGKQGFGIKHIYLYKELRFEPLSLGNGRSPPET